MSGISARGLVFCMLVLQIAPWWHAHATHRRSPPALQGTCGKEYSVASHATQDVENGWTRIYFPVADFDCNYGVRGRCCRLGPACSELPACSKLRCWLLVAGCWLLRVS